MKKTVKKIIILLLLVTFLKGLVWSFFIPLWHFPDEQAHFALVEYLAEGGQPPVNNNPNLSEEILTSERILRTKRDGWGNNAYTYHPEFNIPYSNAFEGLREKEITDLPKSTRKNFLRAEAATYGFSYYKICTFIYYLFYEQNLFVRVFSVRIFWLGCMLGTVWFAYLIAKEIFLKKSWFILIVPLLVAFQPMFTFVSSGITVDNWVNFLFTGMIYFSLKIFIHPSILNVLGSLIFLNLGVTSKNNFMIAFSVFLPAIFFFLLKNKKLFIKLLPLILPLVLIFYFKNTYLQILIKEISAGRLPYFNFIALPQLTNYSLWQHMLWTGRHTIAEVIPWYWGVFRWLSLILPSWVNHILMRLLLLSGVGLVIQLIFKRENWRLWFIFYTAVSYFLILATWDWFFYRTHSYSFGIQGRYYFPVIIPHMILLTVGLETFFKTILKLIKKFIKLKKRKYNLLVAVFHFLLSFWFIILNLIAFYVVTVSYYSPKSFYIFIIQASQYKPWFAKGNYLVALLFIYGLSLIFFITQLAKFFLTYANKKDKHYY